MTQIDFYFNAVDKVQLSARLGSKAVGQFLSGTPLTRMFLYTPDEATTLRVQAALWSANPTAFLPNCRTAQVLSAETPLIVDCHAEALPHDEVLLNLCAQHPPFFSRFHRLIEVVGTREDDKAAARERFRFYRDRGYEIRSHDVSGKA